MRRYNISLRIWHPTMRGDDIADLIGHRASVIQNVGEPRTTPKGNLVGRLNSESYCAFLLIEHAEGSFVDGIERLLPRLEGKVGVLKRVAEDGGVTELYVWIFPEDDTNFGFVVEPATIAAICSLRVRLSVEMLLDADEPKICSDFAN